MEFVLIWIILSIAFSLCSILVSASKSEKEISDREQIEYLRKWRKKNGIKKNK